MPGGVSASGSGAASANRSACSIRVSISRTLPRYSSSFRRSRGASLRWRSRASSRTKSSSERCRLLPALEARLALAGLPLAEEAFEQEPGVGLGRDRRGGRAPGEVVLVGARVAGVAVAGLADGVAAQFERAEPGEVADLAGDDLVDRDARVDVGAGGLADADAGEERAAGAGVVAGSVGAGGGVHVVETGDDLDAVFDRFQRLHRAVEGEVLALALGPPGRRDRAVGEVNEGRPHRRARRSGRRGLGRRAGGAGGGSGERFEGRQRHAGAHAPKEPAAAQRGTPLGGDLVRIRSVRVHRSPPSGSGPST